MKIEIKVPQMGESISEVVIGTLLFPSGSSVKADDSILEVETDKVNQLLYAPQAGILQLSVKPGDRVKVGQVIGYVESQEGVAEKKPVQEPPKQEVETKPSKPEVQDVRQTKADSIAKLKEQPALEAKTQKPPQIEVKGRETRKKMSNIRKVIAKRMLEAQQTTAMLTTFNEIDLSEVIRLREKFKESFMKKYGTKLGFMSFFVKASVSALQSFPELNSYIDGDDIVHREYYDIGVAVGSEKGVVVPVIRDCDKLTFAQIEIAIDEYAKKIKEGKIAVSDLQGGGFTITNGGVYGSLLSTPILNPPQSGILGMHKIEKRPVAINDQTVIRPMMYVALSYDHRIVDGREAVTFLVHLKELLEDPSRLLLDI